MNILPLRSQLRRLRRRDRIVRFASHATLAIAGAAAAAPWLYLWSGSPAAIAFATLVSLLAAWAAASAFGPSERAVAVAVDRALTLEDRVVTGVQHLADTDVVSRLVVADAERRLHGVMPAAVFPFSVPKRFGPLAVIAIVTSLAGVAMLAGSDEADGQRRSAPQSGGEAAPAAGRSEADPAGAARTGSPTGNVAVRRTGAASSTAPATGAEAASPTAIASGQERSASPATPVQRDRRSTASTASGRGLRTRGGSDATSGNRNLLSGGLSGSSRPNASETVRGEGAPGGERARGSGGRDRRQTRARSTIPLDKANTRESAMERDNVPAGLRAYVRDYFALIRAAGATGGASATERGEGAQRGKQR